MSSPTAETAPRFFYGWVIVFVAAVKGAFNVGSAVFATSVFLVPMQEDLGWSRTLIFGALSVRTLAGGMLSPIVGPWGDHPWAPRVALPIGSVLFGLSFMFVKWADTPLEYYLTYGVLGALGLALTSNPILEGVVLKWFIRKRAQAIMWMQVGPPTGPMIFPLILTFLITAVGWRDAWMWLGIAATAVFLPLSLLVRTSPESMGLLPDGDRPGAPPPPSSAGGRRGVPGNERSFTRAEAIRSKSFWMLCLALALSIVGLPGFQAHWVPYLVDIDFSREVAASALVVFGIFSVSARFVWGYLTARHDIRNLMVLQAFLAVLGVFFLLGVQNTVMMYAWAVYHGLTLAVFFQLQALLVVTYFGRGHIGAIRGVMFPFITLGSAMGPILLGALYDWQGSYLVPFSLVIVMWLLAALVVFMTRPPRPVEEPATEAGSAPAPEAQAAPVPVAGTAPAPEAKATPKPEAAA